MRIPLIRQGEGPAAALARHLEERAAEQRRINHIISQATTDTVYTRPTRGTLPGDQRALRGIPVVGARGVGGAIPGSRPGARL